MKKSLKCKNRKCAKKIRDKHRYIYCSNECGKKDMKNTAVGWTKKNKKDIM